MKKLLATFCLISSGLFADPYISVGAGPLSLIPCVGFGYKQDFENGQLDLSFQYSYDYYFDIGCATAAWNTFIPRTNFYLGALVGNNFFNDRDFGDWYDTTIGFVIGQQWQSQFVDISCQRELYSKRIKTRLPMVRVRTGVMF